MGKTVLLLVCLFALANAACVRSQSTFNYDEYEKHRDEGKQFMLSGQFDAARKSYEKALEIAVGSGRGDTIALASANLAQSYCSDKRFEECEEKLDTARDDCLKDVSCGSGPFGVLINQTRFLYVFLLKDFEKTDSLYELLEQSREKLGNEEYDRLGCKYAAELNETRSIETSKKLFKRHNCQKSEVTPN